MTTSRRFDNLIPPEEVKRRAAESARRQEAARVAAREEAEKLRLERVEKRARAAFIRAGGTAEGWEKEKAAVLKEAAAAPAKAALDAAMAEAAADKPKIDAPFSRRSF